MRQVKEKMLHKLNEQARQPKGFLTQFTKHTTLTCSIWALTRKAGFCRHKSPDCVTLAFFLLFSKNVPNTHKVPSQGIFQWNDEK